MGFDPECILQPEQVPGEYYCPLCRQLVHPAEVQQTLCGHLFCRPCVLYIVGTTRCCPYENHPINEGEPKNLQETNPQVFEAIGRIGVRCLFHKSGCVWQGLLSDSAAHSAGCAYGNSPVYCNRCGVQILHRQVQEHAQTCTGIAQYPAGAGQAQQTLAAPDAAQAQAQPVAVQQPTAQHVQQTPVAPNQSQAQPISAPQAPIAADQWYQQQYQQYYQQQYEQYQQQYQQYQQYQQQQQQQQQVPVATTQQYMQAQPQPFPVQQPVAQNPQVLPQQPVVQTHSGVVQQAHHPLAQPQAPSHVPQLQAHHPQPTHGQPQQQPFAQPHPQFQQAQSQPPSHAQQMNPQQVHAAMSAQPQQFQPQSHVHPSQAHPQVPAFQAHPQQPHPQQPHVLQPLAQQPYPHQQPYPQQPQTQQPQPFPQQPQVAHAQMQTHHPQPTPGPVSIQQQAPWELSQQPRPVVWGPDGSQTVAQNQAAGVQHMHQQQQGQGHWQGKNIAGQGANLPAHHSFPTAFQQSMQPRPGPMQPSQQVRPGMLGASPSQAVSGAAKGLQAPKQGPPSLQNVNGPPSTQQMQPSQGLEKAPGAISQPGTHGTQDAPTSQGPSVDGNDASKPLGPNGSEGVGPKIAQKGADGQVEQPSVESKGDLKATPSADSKQQPLLENKGAQQDAKGGELEPKQEPAVPGQRAQSPMKSTQPQATASQAQQNMGSSEQKAKQAPQNLQALNVPQVPQKHQNPAAPQVQGNQTAPLLQRSPALVPGQHNQIPFPAQQNHGLLQHHHNQGLHAFQQKAAGVPHPLPYHELQPQGTRSSVPQLYPQPAHQGQRPLIQDPLLPRVPQMAGLPRPRAPVQPQPGPGLLNPATNPALQVAPRQPGGDGMFGMSQFMNARPTMHPEQKLPLPGQIGAAAQVQSFAQGPLRDQPVHWRPSGPGYMKESHSPSSVPSPLTPSLITGGLQRGYPDPPNSSILPPPPQLDVMKPLADDKSRHLMEQIAAYENETRSGKSFESDKFPGPRPEDSFLLEAQKRRSMFGPEPSLQRPGFRDASPPRPSELLPRFPPAGSHEMPPRGPPHHPLGAETDIGSRSAIPSDISLGREFSARSGFPSGVFGGRDFPTELGLSNRKVSEFGGPLNPLEDARLRSGFSLDSSAHVKNPSDPFRPGVSPDFGPRHGPLSDIGVRHTPPRPPFHLDNDARSKFHTDMDQRPPFPPDGDYRSKFGDMELRPPMALDSESRLKFSQDPDIARPPFHLDNFRPRFSLDNERPGLHLEEQRTRFPLDKEPKSRFDLDVDSRRNFELRPEDRARPPFSSDIGLQSRFPHSDTVGGHAEGLGLSSDFLGPRGDIMRSRTDSISSIRSPGREPPRRDPFHPGWREPFGHFDSLHGGPPLGPDVGRNALRFEDPRMKGRDLHPNPLLHEGRPFHGAGRGHHKAGPGPGYPPSLGAHRPPLGFLNGGPPFKPGAFGDDAEHTDQGRKRKQGGSSGWCRICHVDCYTVQGLEEHSKSEEHQKKTLDLVMSIKQDSAKKQKPAKSPDASKESPKTVPAEPEKAAKSDDEDDDDDDDDGSESD